MKRKLLESLLLVVILSSIFISMGNTKINKESIDEEDEFFLNYVLTSTKDSISYNYQFIYNDKLEKHGRLYDFILNGKTGYALLIEIQGKDCTLYEVEEIKYEGMCPFLECKGTPVYITHRLYLDYYKDEFYNLIDGQIMSKDEVKQEANKGFYYRGGGYYEDKSETIEYSRKETQEYSIKYDLPDYYGKIGETQCANIAGAVLIGYYDRYCENLIPNFKSYTQLGPTIRYKKTSKEILDLSEELHGLMVKDVEQKGSTFAEFQYGMEKYVSNHGYRYLTDNIFSLGEFDFEKYKQSVESKKPVAIFMSGFAFLNNIEKIGNKDLIKSDYCYLTHVVIGCGYKEEKYYDDNGTVTETRIYLKVSSLLSDYHIGYLNINGYGNIDKAIKVEIK